MKLYLHTPLYHNSLNIANILADYMLYPQDEDLFLELTCFANSEVSIGCTIFENLPDNYQEMFLEKLSLPLDTQRLETVIKSTKEENTYASYIDVLFERFGKKIISKNFRLNSVGKITTEDIQIYHKKYYQKARYVMTDDEDNIIESNISEKPVLDKIEINFKNASIIYKQEKNNILYFKINNANDLYLWFFLKDLLYFHNKYYLRYLGGDYYFDKISYYNYFDFVALFLPSEYKLNLNKEFFDKFKLYFVSNIDTSRYNYIMALSLIQTQDYLSKNRLSELMQNIEYDYINKFLS